MAAVNMFKYVPKCIFQGFLMWTAMPYHTTKRIKKGAFGTVYSGSFHGTPVAVKKVQFGSAGMVEVDIQHEINISL